MKEKKEKLRVKSFIFFISPIKKNLFFFFVYSLIFLMAIFNSHNFLWLFLGFLLVFLWKVFFGLSWLNFNFLLLSLFQIKMITFFFNFFWLLIITCFLLFLLFQKIFDNNLKHSSFFRLFTFYYLFFFWIFFSLGIYFFLNLSFILCFLFFIFGLIIYSWIYFVMKGRKFLPGGLLIILLNAEIFWLINYLTLPIPYLALVIFLNYWLVLYYSYRFKII